MTVHDGAPKHALFASLPFWGHLRGLICFTATLLRLDRSLYITFFNHKLFQKAVIDLLHDIDLSADEQSRLHLIVVGSEEAPDPLTPMGEIPDALLADYLEPLFRGESVAGYMVLPAPTVVVADLFAHRVVDRVRERKFDALTLTFCVLEPSFIVMNSDRLARRKEILGVKGGPHLHEYEINPASIPLPTEQTIHLQREAWQSIESGHGLLLAWSRELAPQAARAHEGHSKKHAVPVIVLEPQYQPSFFQPASFPKDDGLFKWVAKQCHNSIVYVSWGSLLFPATHAWQIEVLLNSLIGAQMPFILNLASATSALLGSEKLDAIKSKIADSGNKTVLWLDQPLLLRHPCVSGSTFRSAELKGRAAIGFVISHGGANTTLESLLCDLPIIFWPFDADQAANAALITHQWDASWELLEMRDLNVGKRLYNHPGYSVQCTEMSLRKELDQVWLECKGEIGRKKRRNAQRAGELLRREHAEKGERYAKEFLSLV